MCELLTFEGDWRLMLWNNAIAFQLRGILRQALILSETVATTGVCCTIVEGTFRMINTALVNGFCGLFLIQIIFGRVVVIINRGQRQIY